MLSWRELTPGQKIGAVFLLTLLVIALPLTLFVIPHSFAERVLFVGLMSAFLGGILDPQSYKLRLGAPLRRDKMPPLCRVLSGAGLLLILIGLFLCYVSFSGV